MTFTNSILAGTTLVREAISSEGYVAGSTGWQIERDGDAEFNDVTIRGDWTLQGTDPDDYMQARIVTGIPRLEWARDGVTYAALALSDSVFGERLSIGSLSGATPNISFTETPEAWVVLGPTVHPGEIILFDGEYIRSGYTDGTGFHKNIWNAVTFQNAFGNIGLGFHNVEYYINAMGRVELRGGTVRAGVTANGTVLFTLPAGFRPTTTVGFPVHNLGSAGAVHPGIRVFSNGQVQCFGYNAGGILNTAFSLDGISFPLEA